MDTSRRNFLIRAGRVAAGALLGRRAYGMLARRDAAARRPNVVLILSDDQHWGDYGFMGHSDVRTPNLDRLASESVVYARGYVTAAVCMPSLGTLITGLYPHQHDFEPVERPITPPEDYFWQARKKRIAYFQQAETLPRVLGRHGYLSFQAGKWWEGSYRDGGFMHGMSHGERGRGGRHGDEGLKIGRETMQPVYDFIDAAGDQPFYLWYAPMMPHWPHDPPERLLERHFAPGRAIEIARYYAMIEWFDETCGQLLDHLDEKGLRENTLVVYLCDNGWVQTTAESPLPSWWPVAPAPKSKYTPYDGGVRTPILLRWPGVLEPRRDDSTPVSSVDFVPTVLSACGVEAPQGLPGLSLLDPARLAARDAVFGEDYGGEFDRSDPQAVLHYRWCVSGRHKLIVPHYPKLQFRQLELYDVLTDPHETKELATEKPEAVKRLLGLVDAWWPIKPRTPPPRS